MNNNLSNSKIKWFTYIPLIKRFWYFFSQNYIEIHRFRLRCQVETGSFLSFAVALKADSEYFRALCSVLGLFCFIFWYFLSL